VRKVSRILVRAGDVVRTWRILFFSGGSGSHGKDLAACIPSVQSVIYGRRANAVNVTPQVFSSIIALHLHLHKHKHASFMFVISCDATHVVVLGFI
jgi:hypothetical protein